MIFDLTIIGAGPAGITAAIYSARKKLNVLVITKDIGGQAALSWEIENYTGFQFISGTDLAKKFEEHMKKFDNITVKKESARKVVRKDNFKVETDKETYHTKSVIISTGREPRKLGVPGEIEYKNKGVTYCATCDGPLFSGKDVAVIGGGNSALDATLQMINIANKIYMIDIGENLIGEQIMIDKVKASGKVEIMLNTHVEEISGDSFVQKIKVGGGKELKVQGVFVEIGSVPVNEPSIENINLNENSEIVVDERCKTNIPGVFACGDVTNVPYKQIVVAAGHGCIASLSAFEYISKM